LPSVIATGSMEPLIYPGDIVILKQMRSEDQIRGLKNGDIIQFKRNEILITHRIIEIESDKHRNLTFHTKGDNNSVEDIETVNPNDIRGVYVCVIPKLGYPTLLLKGQVNKIPEDVSF
jgi:signal peptidase